MGFLQSLIGGGAAEVVKAVGGAADSLFTSDAERLQLKNDNYRDETARFKEENRANILNAQANVEEAKRGFGWRTLLGYVVDVSVGMYFIPKYTLAAIFWTKLCWSTGTLHPYPVDSTELIQLVMTMLGFGGIKAWEKKQGVRK